MKPEYTLTNYGLYIQLPIAPMEDYDGYYYGLLACSTTGEPETDWTVIYLHRKPENTALPQEPASMAAGLGRYELKYKFHVSLMF